MYPLSYLLTGTELRKANAGIKHIIRVSAGRPRKETVQLSLPFNHSSMQTEQMFCRLLDLFNSWSKTGQKNYELALLSSFSCMKLEALNLKDFLSGWIG